MLYPDLPIAFFNKRFNGLALGLVQRVRVGKTGLFGIFGKRYYFFMFQIRQSFMIAVRERASDDFFHYRCLVARLKFFERVIVSGAIDKLYIDGYVSFADEQVIIDCSSDAAIAIDERVRIFERKVQTCNPAHDVLMHYIPRASFS